MILTLELETLYNLIMPHVWRTISGQSEKGGN